MLIIHIHFSNLPTITFLLSIISPIIIFNIKFLNIIPFIIISSIESMKIIRLFIDNHSPIIFFIINFISKISPFFRFLALIFSPSYFYIKILGLFSVKLLAYSFTLLLLIVSSSLRPKPKFISNIHSLTSESNSLI